MGSATPDIPAVERNITEMTNVLRAGRKLGEVRLNAQLTAAARAYAQFLANSQTFSHTADGREAGDRITAAGYPWCLVGENLASHLDSRGFQSRDLAKKAVEGWLNSPGHRDNMLAPNITETGVGVAVAPNEHPKYIAVQLFARPKSLSYEFQISNSARQPVTYSFGGEAHDLAPGTAVQHESCVPGPLSFDKLGGKALPVSARFEASGGTVYVVKPDKTKGLVVEIEALQKVE